MSTITWIQKMREVVERTSEHVVLMSAEELSAIQKLHTALGDVIREYNHERPAVIRWNEFEDFEKLSARLADVGQEDREAVSMILEHAAQLLLSLQKWVKLLDVEDLATKEASAGPADSAWKDAPVVTPVSSTSTLAITDEELCTDFVTEAQEHFETADKSLMILEKDPSNTEAMATTFRVFHSIKGVASFIDLTPIVELAHDTETLLDPVRRQVRKFEGEVACISFRSLDALKIMVGDLARGLKQKATVVPVSIDIGPLLADIRREIALANELRVDDASDIPDTEVYRRKTGSGLTDTSSAESDQEKVSTEGGSVATRRIRVDTAKMDSLLDGIGELVIAESIVAQAKEVMGSQAEGFLRDLRHLSKVTRQLQDTAMSMRTVPIEGIFNRMARLTRDLSVKTGKAVEFLSYGSETELDRGMVERLVDPLVHLIRNAVDHGIESDPSVREARGKSRIARLTLQAYHQGGNVHLQVIDDGAGLNRNAIIASAVSRGLIESGEGMSDSEVFSLIFRRGLSTAKTITDVSGRGVGMDVVKKSIESLRGNITVASQEGKGTTFTIVLPLTLAIINGTLAEVGRETYIVPTLSVVQSVRPTPAMLSTLQEGREFIMFRNAIIPLYRVASILRCKTEVTNPCDGIVMIVDDSGQRAGFLMDSILGQHQVVIKSLGDTLRQVEGISGACILSNGRPGLILDVGEIMRLGLEESQHEHRGTDKPVPPLNNATSEEGGK